MRSETRFTGAVCFDEESLLNRGDSCKISLIEVSYEEPLSDRVTGLRNN